MFTRRTARAVPHQASADEYDEDNWSEWAAPVSVMAVSVMGLFAASTLFTSARKEASVSQPVAPTDAAAAMSAAAFVAQPPASAAVADAPAAPQPSQPAAAFVAQPPQPAAQPVVRFENPVNEYYPVPGGVLEWRSSIEELLKTDLKCLIDPAEGMSTEENECTRGAAALGRNISVYEVEDGFSIDHARLKRTYVITRGADKDPLRILTHTAPHYGYAQMTETNVGTEKPNIISAVKRFGRPD